MEYADNQPLLDMLGLPKKKGGKATTVFSVLDEKTNLESGTDADFLSAIKRHFGAPAGGGAKGKKKTKGNAGDDGPPSSSSSLFDGFVKDSDVGDGADANQCFKICHYAGHVAYNSVGFKEKNLDKVRDARRRGN